MEYLVIAENKDSEASLKKVEWTREQSWDC